MAKKIRTHCHDQPSIHFGIRTIKNGASVERGARAPTRVKSAYSSEGSERELNLSNAAVFVPGKCRSNCIDSLSLALVRLIVDADASVLI
jgi:hypothetical protein